MARHWCVLLSRRKKTQASESILLRSYQSYPVLNGREVAFAHILKYGFIYDSQLPSYKSTFSLSLTRIS
jgi:hypothetical protein